MSYFRRVGRVFEDPPFPYRTSAIDRDGGSSKTRPTLQKRGHIAALAIAAVALLCGAGPDDKALPPLPAVPPEPEVVESSSPSSPPQALNASELTTNSPSNAAADLMKQLPSWRLYAGRVRARNTRHDAGIGNDTLSDAGAKTAPRRARHDRLSRASGTVGSSRNSRTICTNAAGCSL